MTLFLFVNNSSSIDAYKESEFVSGSLAEISNGAGDGARSGIVRLDRGLITNQNRAIQYSPGLHAQALIITKSMRLLEMLYYSIIKAASAHEYIR